MQTSMLAIGLMSGTSADGVDAALIETDGENQYRFIDTTYVPYERDVQRRLIRSAKHDVPLIKILKLEREITDIHLTACQELMAKTDGQPRIIGFHGHTIRHSGADRLTWQIGDASRLSQRLGIAVVSDFRRADIGAGGQGAPLAPLFHRQLFAAAEKPCVILNLGGVANITWLGRHHEILAGDTGPGCGLLDEWIQAGTGEPLDLDGAIATAGTVHEPTVCRALAEPFFQRPLPKSADRYEFHIDLSTLSLSDGAATLCAITARAIELAIAQALEPPRTIWMTGGGARNPVITSMLVERFRDVRNVTQHGQRADTMEAECFGWLAVRRLLGRPTSLPETTGCQRATCGGVVTYAMSD